VNIQGIPITTQRITAYYRCSTPTIRVAWGSTREIKSRISIATTAFNKKTLFTTELGLNLREKVSKFLHCEHNFVGAEIWTLRKVDHKYTQHFEMWCWRRTEKFIWTDLVGNKVLRRVNG